jgi:hypothetical protein
LQADSTTPSPTGRARHGRTGGTPFLDLRVAGALPSRVRLPIPLAIVAAVSLSTACSQDSPNPFAAALITQPVPTSSDIIFASSFDRAPANSPNEIYAFDSRTAQAVRLTQCERSTPACSLIEAAPAPDVGQLAARAVTQDTNGDGRLADRDHAALVFIDLNRGLRQELVPAEQVVTGVDWSPTQRMLVFNAAGAGGLDDIFRHDLAQTAASVNLTQTPDVPERRARFDRNGDFVVCERVVGGERSTLWAYASQAQQQAITRAGDAGAQLPESPYTVGSDADPRISLDHTWVVFRRLVAAGPDGLGFWDILMAKVDGSFDERVVASGPVFRGAPDWGDKGILFNEIDDASSRLVLVDPATGARRTLFTAAPTKPLAFPRWLAGR